MLAGVSISRPRPVDVAHKVPVPVLVLQGTADTLIPVDDARRLAREFPTPARLIEIPGAGHTGIVETGGAPLLDRVAAFLDDAVAARVPGP